MKPKSGTHHIANVKAEQGSANVRIPSTNERIAKMTRVTLIRHCEAMGNYERIFQGHTDADISENGKIQLELLSVRCRNMPIDVLYSSPLKRAYLTAEAVNTYHHLPIQVDAGLVEINGGLWEGEKWEELPALYPEHALQWNTKPYDFAPPQGESMRQVYDRMWNTVTKIVAENQEKKIVITSHGCAIRNFLCHAMGKPIEQLNDVDWCDNTAISIIDFDEAMEPHIVLLNDSSHLTEETSTFSKQNWWKPENRGGSSMN
jgi:broad specificity phosphatase PhoE